MRTRCLIVNELTLARMPAVAPSMSGTASVPDRFAGITLRPAPNSTGVPIATGISVIATESFTDTMQANLLLALTCFEPPSCRFAVYHPPTHNQEPYDTLLYCPTSCPYRSVCGTDAACSSNTVYHPEERPTV
jgi:hypothetical protein